MRFLIDNALSPLLAQRLVEEGFDAVHIREYNMQSASDEDIFRLAQREDRIIISADTDQTSSYCIKRETSSHFLLLSSYNLFKIRRHFFHEPILLSHNHKYGKIAFFGKFLYLKRPGNSKTEAAVPEFGGLPDAIRRAEKSGTADP